MAASDATRWPTLPLANWQATRDTLHLYSQVVGKIRLANEPPINHWWNSTLYVTASGLTTSLMPHATGDPFQIDFDFLHHRLEVTTTTGARRSLPLDGWPVADFYDAVMASLDELGVPTEIWPMPVEIAGAVPFTEDRMHASYDPDAVRRFWLALVELTRVFTLFRTRFVGKSSPVHLFWGALDLAHTRFSGRPAPLHPGGAPNCGPHVMWEAYSHEVSSCGYWPGPPGEEGVFYAYAYPEPPGYRDAAVTPPGHDGTTRWPSSSCLRDRSHRRRSGRRAPRVLAVHLRGRRHHREVGTGPPSNDPTEAPFMAETCTHLDTVTRVTPSSDGCEDCLRIGGRWVHLRLCMRCGHVGCCDNSPNRHATAHWHEHTDHPLIRSYEPGEDWWWCYPDELFFDIDGAPPAPSHP